MMIYGHLLDGNVFDVSPITGKELIKKVWTDDFAIPPQSMTFDTSTKDGKRVRIIVPFDDKSDSYAVID